MSADNDSLFDEKVRQIRENITKSTRNYYLSTSVLEIIYLQGKMKEHRSLEPD